MTRRAPRPGPSPRHVSLVALPDAVVSTLFGIFDVMNAFGLMGISTGGSSGEAPIHTEIVGEAVGRLRLRVASRSTCRGRSIRSRRRTS